MPQRLPAPVPGEPDGYPGRPYRRRVRWTSVRAVLLVLMALLGTLMARAGGTVATSSRAVTPKQVEPLPPDVAPPTRTPPQVLFLGDSLTWGFAAVDANHAFASQVTSGLGAVRVGFDGQYGNTVQMVAGQIAQIPLPTEVAFVVVELGTNDSEPDSVFASAYQALLDDIRVADPRARLVCISPWQPEDHQYTLDHWRTIQMQCAAAGGSAISLYSVFSDPRVHGPAGSTTYRGTSDAFHPNDAGHAAIAALVLAALRAPSHSPPPS